MIVSMPLKNQLAAIVAKQQKGQRQADLLEEDASASAVEMFLPCVDTGGQGDGYYGRGHQQEPVDGCFQAGMASNEIQEKKEGAGRHQSTWEVCDHRVEAKIANKIVKQTYLFCLSRDKLRTDGTADRANWGGGSSPS